MWIRYREERRPHPYEDKMRALELYLRYDRSAAAVINELSYPDRQTLRLRYRKLEVSKKTSFRYLTMGRPPLQRSIAPHAASNPLDRCTQPATPIPNPHRNSLPQASHHRFQTAPKPTPATSAFATSSSLASSPKPQPQTSKQSRACVRNIAWNNNRLPRPPDHPNSSTTCGFSFILQSLK